jgi:hypothetical protein
MEVVLSMPRLLVMEHVRSIEVKVKDEKEFSWTRRQAP